MEAGLDNSNNPFGVPNGANTDIISQKTDGLLLNLTDNYKQNGTDLQPSDFFSTEKSNGKRLALQFDDDFGPETDVDALDDALSPAPLESITKSFADAFSPSSPNNNLLTDEGVFNPFMEHQEKAALEMEKNLKKQESRDEFEEEERMDREETPTPPVDAVQDVSGLVENPADSESEDEWNYFKGDEANKENISPQPEKEAADILEEDDNMSQLNPNAAEFVPVSPTRSVPSPTCRMLINDQIVSQSPRKANDVDLSVPSPNDFEKEIKSRPSEIDSNGHDEESDLNTSKDLMENILNGKNIDEIPEFQPGSTPKKVFPSDEFHFGPNAAPFTPKLLDQSEAFSTKAVYGDESVNMEITFDESINPDILNKESDPMSASFYADKGESNPFDLDSVQVLPENLDEFLSKPDNETFDDSISDLPEHHPLGEPKNNDDAIQITDLDKHSSYDDEKELASPLEPEKELLTAEQTDFSKTPEPTNEHLLGEEFCCEPKNEEITTLPADVELISPIQEASEVRDLLGKETMEDDKVDTESDLSNKEATQINDFLNKGATEITDFLTKESTEINDFLNKEITNDGGFLNKDATDFSDYLSKEVTEVNDFLNKNSTEVSDYLNKEVTEVKNFISENVAEASDYLNKDETEVSDCLNKEVKEVSDFITKDPEAVSDYLHKEVEELNDFVTKDSETVSEVAEVGDFLNKDKSEVDDLLNKDVIEVGDPSKYDSESLPPDVEMLPQDIPLSKPSDHKDILMNEASTTDIPIEPVSQFSQPELEEFARIESAIHSEVNETNKKEIQDNPSLVPGSGFEPICELPVELNLNTKSPECDKVDDDDLLPPEPIPVAPLPTEQESKISVEELEKYVKIDLAVTPEPIPEHFKLVQPEDVESKSSVCDLLESKSPIPEEPLSPDYTKQELLQQAEERFEELCKPMESPQEEVTSSIKDDLSSPVQDLSSKSPLMEHILEDSFVMENVVDNSLIKEEVAEVRTSSNIYVPLEQSQPPEDATEENAYERLCICPPRRRHKEEVELPIDVKTETISPEFAEPAVVTPSEESKAEDLVASTPEDPVKEVVNVEQQVSGELKNDMTAVGIVAAVATGAAIAAVASTTKIDDKKKSSSATSVKKTATGKTPTTTKSLTSKTSPRLSSSAIKQSSSKTTSTLKATKTGAPKPSVTNTSAPKTTPRLSLSKSKATVSSTTKMQPPKSSEKSSLTNGEIKSTVRSTLTVKKPTLEVNGTKTSSSKLTGPSKVTQSKLTTKPPPTAALKTSIPPRSVPSTNKVATSAVPKRPTTLTSRTVSGNTSPDKTASAHRTNLSKPSPKSATNVLLKSKPIANTLSKPRVPLTKTVAKAPPDTEKQIKESANKITASRSAFSAKPIGSTTRTTISSARKVDSKVSSTRTTVTKTTTTTMKSTTGKKPAELVKGTVTKTKTTKIEKPKENGISTVVTEEITAVNKTNAVIDSQPELIKDNSPVDNKLLTDTTQLIESNAD